MLVETTTSNKLPPQHFIYGLNPIITWLNRHDIDHKPFLERIHVSPESLLKAQQTITLEKEIAFIQDVYQSVNRPELGLLVGPNYHLSLFGILGLAATSSQDLVSAYKVFTDNFVMIWSHCHVRILSDNKYAYFEIKPYKEFGDLLPFLIERDMSGMLRIISEILEQPIPLTRIELSYPKTTYSDLYESIFQCPIIFNAKHNRAIFDKQWLDTSLPKADPVTCQVFMKQCQENATLLRQQPSFSEQLRNLLINNDTKTVTLGSIAKLLNTTPRSIQRKLAMENITFRALSNDMRYKISAKYLLSTTLSLENIAERMGFNDASAFSNTFKRWSGLSPRQYRKEKNV